MTASNRRVVFWVFVALAGLLLAGCAAGNARFTDASPAGFWNGLWHGLILVVAFIVSLFSDAVTIYEVDNSGGWYNFGFVLGAMIILGGGSHTGAKGARHRKRQEEWEELGDRIEEEVKRHVEQWLDEREDEQADVEGEDVERAPRDASDEDWEEIAKKVQAKLKRRIRKWADEE